MSMAAKLFSGTKNFWRCGRVVDINLFYHFEQDCLELIYYSPANDFEYPRIYFQRAGLLREVSKASIEDDSHQDERIALAAEDVPPAVALLGGKLQLARVIKFVQLKLDYLRAGYGLDILFDPHLFENTLVPSTGNYIIDKPEDLIPSTVRHKKAFSMSEFQETLQAFNEDVVELTSKNQQAQRNSEALASTVDNVQQISHDRCKKRWQSAYRKIRWRIMKQNIIGFLTSSTQSAKVKTEKRPEAKAAVSSPARPVLQRKHSMDDMQIKENTGSLNQIHSRETSSAAFRSDRASPFRTESPLVSHSEHIHGLQKVPLRSTMSSNTTTLRPVQPPISARRQTAVHTSSRDDSFHQHHHHRSSLSDGNDIPSFLRTTVASQRRKTTTDLLDKSLAKKKKQSALSKKHSAASLKQQHAHSKSSHHKHHRTESALKSRKCDTVQVHEQQFSTPTTSGGNLLTAPNTGESADCCTDASASHDSDSPPLSAVEPQLATSKAISAMRRRRMEADSEREHQDSLASTDVESGRWRGGGGPASNYSSEGDMGTPTAARLRLSPLDTTPTPIHRARNEDTSTALQNDSDEENRKLHDSPPTTGSDCRDVGKLKKSKSFKSKSGSQRKLLGDKRGSDAHQRSTSKQKKSSARYAAPTVNFRAYLADRNFDTEHPAAAGAGEASDATGCFSAAADAQYHAPLPSLFVKRNTGKEAVTSTSPPIHAQAQAIAQAHKKQCSYVHNGGKKPTVYQQLSELDLQESRAELSSDGLAIVGEHKFLLNPLNIAPSLSLSVLHRNQLSADSFHA